MSTKVTVTHASTGQKEEQCNIHICTDVPEICGSPPPPCDPCCDPPKLKCRPVPTRHAIKLKNGEVGRFFTFGATEVGLPWYGHLNKMSLTLVRAGGDKCCREFCFAPSGVTADGRVYYAWSQEFMKAPAGYYLATFRMDGHAHRETMLFKPYSYVSVHASWGEFPPCEFGGGVITPVTKGCGCSTDTCCTHLPQAIQEEFIEQVDCGVCDDRCN